MSKPVDEQRKYPTAAEVLANRGKGQVTMHPDVTVELADICEEMGGCEEGVEWGRTHSIDDVADDFLPEWGAWIMHHLGANLAPDVRVHFLSAATRDNPVLAATYYMRRDDLTEEEYTLIEAKASELPAVSGARASGSFVRADRRAH